MAMMDEKDELTIHGRRFAFSSQSRHHRQLQTGIQVPHLLPAFTALHTILAGISAATDRRL
jgi:hypothetical protein